MRSIILTVAMLLGALIITSTLAGMLQDRAQARQHYDTVGDSAVARN